MIYFTLPLAIYSLLSSLTTAAYDDSSCSYFATHVLAVPLETCAVYSYDHTHYSWDFFCNLEDELKVRYYDGDTNCSLTDETQMTSVDEIGSAYQCIGAGSNCHTVDITVKGFTGGDSCEDENDYYAFSFVVDECVPSVLEETNYSAILSCDSEKLYFEYYTGCLDCICEMETYTYEYYSDFDGCWDVICGLHEQSGIGSIPTTTQVSNNTGRCKQENVDSDYHANKLKHMLSKQMGFTKAAYSTSKTKQFMTNVIINENNKKHYTVSLYNRIIMNGVSIVAVLCIIIVLVGTWNFIKEKEYSII